MCVVVMPKQFESLDPKAAGLVACRLFLENLDSILSGEAQKAAQPQDESEVSHTGKIAKKEGKISWEKSAEQLHNQVSRTLRRLLLSLEKTAMISSKHTTGSRKLCLYPRLSCWSFSTSNSSYSCWTEILQHHQRLAAFS